MNSDTSAHDSSETEGIEEEDEEEEMTKITMIRPEIQITSEIHTDTVGNNVSNNKVSNGRRTGRTSRSPVDALGAVDIHIATPDGQSKATGFGTSNGALSKSTKSSDPDPVTPLPAEHPANPIRKDLDGDPDSHSDDNVVSDTINVVMEGLNVLNPTTKVRGARAAAAARHRGSEHSHCWSTFTDQTECKLQQPLPCSSIANDNALCHTQIIKNIAPKLFLQTAAATDHPLDEHKASGTAVPSSLSAMIRNQSRNVSVNVDISQIPRRTSILHDQRRTTNAIPSLQENSASTQQSRGGAMNRKRHSFSGNKRNGNKTVTLKHRYGPRAQMEVQCRESTMMQAPSPPLLDTEDSDESDEVSLPPMKVTVSKWDSKKKKGKGRNRTKGISIRKKKRQSAVVLGNHQDIKRAKARTTPKRASSFFPRRARSPPVPQMVREIDADQVQDNRNKVSLKGNMLKVTDEPLSMRKASTLSPGKMSTVSPGRNAFGAMPIVDGRGDRTQQSPNQLMPCAQKFSISRGHRSRSKSFQFLEEHRSDESATPSPPAYFHPTRLEQQHYVPPFGPPPDEALSPFYTNSPVSPATNEWPPYHHNLCRHHEQQRCALHVAEWDEPLHRERGRTSTLLWGQANPTSMYPNYEYPLWPQLNDNLCGKQIDSVFVAKEGGHCLGIGANHWCFVWGEVDHPEVLGLGNTCNAKTTAPSLVRSLRKQRVMACALSARHSLCITEEGVIYGWGSKNLTLLGMDTNEPTPLQYLNGKGLDHVSACNTHSLVWKKNKLHIFSFGIAGPWLGFDDDNVGGAAHHKSTFGVMRFDPSMYSKPHGIAAADCCSGYSLLVLTTGYVGACGINEHGRMGIGKSVIRSGKVLWNESLRRIVRVSAGPFHSGFVDTEGAVFVAGVGHEHRLGLGHCDTVFTPQRVRSVSSFRVREVECIAARTYVITTGSQMIMWGKDPATNCIHRAPFTYSQLSSYRVYSVCGGQDFTVVNAVYTEQPLPSIDFDESVMVNADYTERREDFKKAVRSRSRPRIHRHRKTTTDRMDREQRRTIHRRSTFDDGSCHHDERDGDGYEETVAITTERKEVVDPIVVDLHPIPADVGRVRKSQHYGPVIDRDDRGKFRPKSARRGKMKNGGYTLRVNDGDPVCRGSVGGLAEDKNHYLNYRKRSETQNDRMIRASSAAVAMEQKPETDRGAAFRQLSLQRSQTNGYREHQKRERERHRKRSDRKVPRRRSERMFDEMPSIAEKQQRKSRRRKPKAIMCSHSDCRCTKFVRNSNGKNRCKNCNHRQQSHNKIYYLAVETRNNEESDYRHHHRRSHHHHHRHQGGH